MSSFWGNSSLGCAFLFESSMVKAMLLDIANDWEICWNVKRWCGLLFFLRFPVTFRFAVFSCCCARVARCAARQYHLQQLLCILCGRRHARSCPACRLCILHRIRCPYTSHGVACVSSYWKELIVEFCCNNSSSSNNNYSHKNNYSSMASENTGAGARGGGQRDRLFTPERYSQSSRDTNLWLSAAACCLVEGSTEQLL